MPNLDPWINQFENDQWITTIATTITTLEEEKQIKITLEDIGQDWFVFYNLKIFRCLKYFKENYIKIKNC